MSDERMRQATAKLIQERLAALGQDMAALARATGVSFTSAHNWAHGKGVPTRKRAASIAKFLEVSETEVLAAIFGDVEIFQNVTLENKSLLSQSSEQASVRPAGVSPLGPRNVPVLGVAVGGKSADFHLNGQIDSYVRRPPAIAELSEVYALHVVGNSMSPRFRDGELVYVHKRTPAIGDDVVVQLLGESDDEPPRGFIKYLIRRNGSHIICGQYEPKGEVRFETDEIVSIHRVIPWHELLEI